MRGFVYRWARRARRIDPLKSRRALALWYGWTGLCLFAGVLDVFVLPGHWVAPIVLVYMAPTTLPLLLRYRCRERHDRSQPRMPLSFNNLITLWVVLFVLTVGASLARPAASQVPQDLDIAIGDGHDVCTFMLRDAEEERGIPDGLLVAVALARTHGGRTGKALLHPWQYRIDGKLHRFADQATFHRNVAVEQSRRGTAIEIGCMLLQWERHDAYWAVDELKEVIEPDRSATYFAGWLARLRAKHGSWDIAVARSWSHDPSRDRQHLCAVARHYAHLLGVAPESTSGWRDNCVMREKETGDAKTYGKR